MFLKNYSYRNNAYCPHHSKKRSEQKFQLRKKQRKWVDCFVVCWKRIYWSWLQIIKVWRWCWDVFALRIVWLWLYDCALVVYVCNQGSSSFINILGNAIAMVCLVWSLFWYFMSIFILHLVSFLFMIFYCKNILVFPSLYNK